MDATNALDDGTSNVSNQTIKVRTNQNVEVNCGSENQLQGVTWNNVDTGGGEFRVVFSYTNPTTLNITDPNNDPAGLAHV